MQVLREAQEEEKRDPMTRAEFLRLEDELMRYGANQAKKMGIKLEDVDRIIREEWDKRKTTNRA
jgi:hypothetical protein